MAIDIKKLNRLINEANEDEDTTQEFDEFSTLDLRQARCFGYHSPKQNSWLNISQQISNVGWNNIDIKQLEQQLALDVEQSYINIAEFKLVNVSDGLSYTLKFDNNKGMWNVCITDSPKAELTAEQQSNFFKSELFNKIAKRAYYWLSDSLKSVQEDVYPHINKGELLLIDVVKLDAILHFLQSKHFLENLRNGKFYAI